MDHNQTVPQAVYNLSDELGSITRAEPTACPGVYLLETAASPKQIVGQMLYAVESDAQEISDGAKRFGMRLELHSDFLIYPIDEYSLVDSIIHYEISKYCARNGLKQMGAPEVRAYAAYGAENYPDYFGQIPAPYLTPHGYLTRYLRLMNGAFWLETDQGEQMLAMTRLLWKNDLDDRVKAKAEFNDFDRAAADFDSTTGYAFFLSEAGALALYDLMRHRFELLLSDEIDREALDNVVMRRWPHYAAAFNQEEQRAVEAGYPNSHIITTHPEKGERFLCF